MATNITIQIPASGPPTGGQEAVAPGGRVKFKADAKTNVDFGNTSPFCPQKSGFQIKAGKSQSFDVCANFGIGGTYNYATTVEGASSQNATLKVLSLVPTDPIVFPEKKPIVFPEDWVALALGIGIGLLVGFLISRLRPVRTTQR